MAAVRAGTRVAELAKRVPPFSNPRARVEFLRRREQAGRLRRHTFERLGSARYSRPALYELDRQLERHLPFEGGFFVEAGAYDGFTQSNTYYFERFKGWRGILVEPIPELCRICVIERPHSEVFNYALVPPDYGKESVRMVYGGLMSVVRGARGSHEADEAHASAGSRLGWDVNYEIDVPARTLSAVLDEARVDAIDLLSLDVEGYEAEVLRGVDFDRHRPSYLLIELLDKEQLRAGVEAALGGLYEAVDELSPYDVLYRRANGRPEA